MTGRWLPDVPVLVETQETKMLIAHCWHHVGAGLWQRDGGHPVTTREALRIEDQEANARKQIRGRGAYKEEVAEARRALEAEEEAFWKGEVQGRRGKWIERHGAPQTVDVSDSPTAGTTAGNESE